MEQMKDLKDLLKHEIQDLYSAEEQIIAAMPKMIEKANNPELKKALQQHLKVTEQQLKRLDKVKKSFGEQQEKKTGGIFGLFAGSQKCKGMEGIIAEGEKVMGENMTPEVLDAAIIASAQKVEHYEICGYGTARAYARELELYEVAELLEETLDEEYEADDLLTDLAVGKINLEAEEADEEYETEEEEEGAAVMANNTRGGAGSGRGNSGGGSRPNASGSKSPAKGSSGGNSGGRSGNGSGRGTTGGGKTAAAKKTSGGRGGNTSSRGNSGSGGGRSAGRKSASKGGAAKKSSKGR